MAKAGIKPDVTKGSLYTIVFTLLSAAAVVVEHHYNPTVEGAQAVMTSQSAVDKAADAAAKAAVLEKTVTDHTQEIGQIMVSMNSVFTDVAVLKSQGIAAKDAADKESDKLDRILMAVSRMQGGSGRGSIPSPDPQK